MRPSALPAAGPVSTITVWAKTPAGATLAHPAHRRAPRDRPKGLSVPHDAFTIRRLQDGDWTTEAAEAVPAAAPASGPAAEPEPAESADPGHLLGASTTPADPAA